MKGVKFSSYIIIMFPFFIKLDFFSFILYFNFDKEVKEVRGIFFELEEVFGISNMTFLFYGEGLLDYLEIVDWE